MARPSEKPALIQKCDGLGISYTSTDSIAELKKKIHDKSYLSEAINMIAQNLTRNLINGV